MEQVSSKKILVYDVAAENGGGLVVLKDFYSDACDYVKANKGVTFVFVTGLPLLKEQENVKVISFPWAKKSWLKRLYFEKIYVKKVLKQIKPDVIVSLQNTTVAGYKGKQYVYMHQSLQYCVKKFSVFKKEERMLAIRQKFICSGYKKGLKKAYKIYVQTGWIKDATKAWIKARDEKIEVVPVTVSNLPSEIPVYDGLKSNCFFYPARAEIYKNHQVILQACRELKKKGIENYKFLLTFNGNENGYAISIKNQSQELPIIFIDELDRKKVFELYSKSILVFPSYLETCGLPLLEAKAFGSSILASDMPFCREGLDGYNNAVFFDYNDASKLAELMEKCITGKIDYKNQNYSRENKASLSLLNAVMKDILNEK